MFDKLGKVLRSCFAYLNRKDGSEDDEGEQAKFTDFSKLPELETDDRLTISEPSPSGGDPVSHHFFYRFPIRRYLVHHLQNRYFQSDNMVNPSYSTFLESDRIRST